MPDVDKYSIIGKHTREGEVVTKYAAQLGMGRLMQRYVMEASPEETLLATEGLLNGADVAILMTATTSSLHVGMAYNGPMLKTGVPPLAWVSLGRSIPTGEISFAHEVGHLLGCRHNREQPLSGVKDLGEKMKNSVLMKTICSCGSPSSMYALPNTDRESEPDGGLVTQETGFGFHVKGSNFYTVMAYPTARHNVWIPYFSAEYFKYRGMPIGNAWNDNRRTLIENRFLVSMTGSEGSTYHESPIRLLSQKSTSYNFGSYHCTSSQISWDQIFHQHEMPILPRC